MPLSTTLSKVSPWSKVEYNTVMAGENKTFVDALITLGFPIDPHAKPTAISAATEALQLSSRHMSGLIILPQEYDSNWVLGHPRDAELLALAQLQPRTSSLLPPADPELKRIFWSHPASLVRFAAASPEDQERYAGVYSPVNLAAIETHLTAVGRQLSLPIQRSPWPQIFEEARTIFKR